MAILKSSPLKILKREEREKSKEGKMKKVEVVFIATPGIGNLVPAVEFAQRLIDRDQRLSATILIIDIPQRPIVGAYVDSRAAAAAKNSPGIRFIHLPPAATPSPDQYQTSIAFTSLLIQNHIPHVKHAISNLLSKSTESNSVSLGALFIDMFCTPMIDIADELNIPCYLYFASPASFLGFMLHLPALDTQLTTEFDQSGSELFIPGFANPVPSSVLPTFVLKRYEEDGYFWFLSHARRYNETKGIIVNSFREIEPHAMDSVCTSQTPPVYAVGPVLDLAGPIQWHPDRVRHETVMTWLDQQPPSSVVFLCFGSMGSLGASQVREIAHGLERSGYRFLWAIREPPRGKMGLPNDYTNIEEVLPDGFLERTDGIGLVCGWVPQVTILAHGAIGGFVSHCGWNSIMESLWYGVPIATWPVYAEQQMNAFQMVRELELAVEIRLDYRDGSNLVHAEEVERGVRCLMDGDNEVRKKVKEMGELSRMAVMENGSSYTSLECLIEELTAHD